MVLEGRGSGDQDGRDGIEHADGQPDPKELGERTPRPRPGGPKKAKEGNGPTLVVESGETAVMETTDQLPGRRQHGRRPLVQTGTGMSLGSRRAGLDGPEQGRSRGYGRSPRRGRQGRPDDAHRTGRPWWLMASAAGRTLRPSYKTSVAPMSRGGWLLLFRLPEEAAAFRAHREALRSAWGKIPGTESCRRPPSETGGHDASPSAGPQTVGEGPKGERGRGESGRAGPETPTAPRVAGGPWQTEEMAAQARAGGVRWRGTIRLQTTARPFNPTGAKPLAAAAVARQAIPNKVGGVRRPPRRQGRNHCAVLSAGRPSKPSERPPQPPGLRG